MLVEHAGNKPSVADSAVVASTAVVSGEVHIGAGTVVLAGAVVTAQGAPVHIGESLFFVLRGRTRVTD